MMFFHVNDFMALINYILFIFLLLLNFYILNKKIDVIKEQIRLLSIQLFILQQQICKQDENALDMFHDM